MRYKGTITGLDGREIQIEVKLNWRGQLLRGMAHFCARFLNWIPPEDGFKAAMQRHSMFRLNGGPWVNYGQFAEEMDL